MTDKPLIALAGASGDLGFRIARWSARAWRLAPWSGRISRPGSADGWRQSV
jgi:hypothetical protein